MASFMQPSYSTPRPGFDRMAAAASTGRAMRRGFDSSKGLSAMLLAAMVSALLVVADQLIGTWANGHLLTVWVALWLVGFAALALFTGTARKLALSAVAAMNAFNAWSERAARARADEHLWALANTDPRVMAELSAAMARGRPC